MTMNLIKRTETYNIHNVHMDYNFDKLPESHRENGNPLMAYSTPNPMFSRIS